MSEPTYRQHPLTIAIGWLKGLKAFVWVVVAVGIQSFGDDESSALSLTVLGLLGLYLTAEPMIAWLRFRYEILGEHFVVTEGVLTLKRREIPLSRIQDLDIKRSPVHRFLGLVSVSIQTSGSTAAEVTLDAISVRAAESLRQRLLGDGSRIAHHAEPSTPVLFRVSTPNLILRGLTDNQAGLVLAGLLSVLHEAAMAQPLVEQLGSAAFIKSVSAGGTTALFLIAAAGIAVFLIGYIASAIVNVVAFYGMELTEVEGSFHRTYGALTRTHHVLPRKRIQALTIRQSFLRRRLGKASVQVHDMGASGAPSKKNVGRDTFIPMGSLVDVFHLSDHIFPHASSTEWMPVSTRLIRRTVTPGVLLTLPALLLWARDPHAWWSVFVPIAAGVVFAIAGLLRHRALRFSFAGGYFAVRDGLLARRWSFVPASRIQTVRLRRNVFDRWHGVSTLLVVVGGGAAFRVPNIPQAVAKRVAAEMNGALG